MTRHAFILAVLVIASSLSDRPGDAQTEGAPADAPKVVLDGRADSELAPHGEGNVYAPHVLVEDERHRMWYGGQGKDGHDRIHYAESDDGTTWARKGVVVDDPKANHVNDPCVVKVGETYWMYYTRTERDVVDRIDVAVSNDGKAWTPKGVALPAGPPGAWDGLSVGRPAVVHEGGVFRMWYDGRKDFPPGAPVKDVPKSPTSTRSVGYATSADGLHWTRHGTGPVFGHDAGGVDVKRLGSRLAMAYESRDGTRFAASGDGIRWADRGLLAKRSGTDVDAFGHVTPCLVTGPDGRLRALYIGAARATTWDRNAIANLGVPAESLDRLLGKSRQD